MRKINLKSVKETPKLKLIKKNQQTQLKGGIGRIIIEDHADGC